MLSGEADTLTATTGRFTTSGATVLPRQIPKQPSTAGDWHSGRPRNLAHPPRVRATAAAGPTVIDEEDWEEF
jgi:hypothetical protein